MTESLALEVFASRIFAGELEANVTQLLIEGMD
jgi:hypothetical protein